MIMSNKRIRIRLRATGVSLVSAYLEMLCGTEVSDVLRADSKSGTGTRCNVVP